MSVVVEQNAELKNKYYVHDLIILENLDNKKTVESLNKSQPNVGTDLTAYSYYLLKKALMSTK